ncbi:DUF3658 domain-containing protein [Bradyrhizobium neotropicale]|uniref:DUF3658 domain-containing protein n=1 Tax=Bradyrhizobium neotropicale TaxID=1497615 RepID=UPI001AD7AECF|nr:DUF3658 domain-containing protein [Bradyrhizobium neotropicale]MBO4222759.1 hypothetical protein [Bradyrhizobium neotropicale]
MNREQAEEIHEHLLDVVESLERAEGAISTLGEEARRMFASGLGAAGDAVYYELLFVLYKKFPDLRPPDKEPPHILSTLRWEEVSLPSSISEADIDRIIFSVLHSQWRKTAAIIGWALDRCGELGLVVSDEVLAARLGALAEADCIESQGDLRMWRHSEVRKKPSN